MDEVEKWRVIRASVDNVGDVPARRGWRASVGEVGGVLAWVTWVAYRRKRR